MSTLTPLIVESIRSGYASGLYSKADLFMNNLGRVKKEDIDDILSYKVFPKVREDLIDRIEVMDEIHNVVGEYHKKNMTLIEIDEQYGTPDKPALMIQEEIQKNNRVAIAKLISLKVQYPETALVKYAFNLPEYDKSMIDYAETLRGKAIKSLQKGSAYAAI